MQRLRHRVLLTHRGKEHEPRTEAQAAGPVATVTARPGHHPSHPRRRSVVARARVHGAAALAVCNRDREGQRVSFSHNVPDRGSVTGTLAASEAAGGTILKPAHKRVFGGVFRGNASNPNGDIWDIALNLSRHICKVSECSRETASWVVDAGIAYSLNTHREALHTTRQSGSAAAVNA